MSTASERRPDDAEPAAERQAELRAAYERNASQGRAPYARVAIRTRGELRWIMRERNWSGTDDELRTGATTTADLRAADLRGAHLEEIRLIWANLTEALLDGTHLDGALLRGVNFTAAHLDDATLAGASLRRAIFSATDLHRTDLCAADLHGARLDALTILRDVKVDASTHFADVVWNNAPLAEVDWTPVRVLGEERDITGAKSRRERIAACRAAIRAYRGLAMALRAQGLSAEALRYRLRAMRLERQVHLLEGRVLPGIGLWLVDWLTGFGTRSQRILLIYVIAVLGYAAAYFFLGQAMHPALTPRDSLILSITAFHGRGLFAGAVALRSPIVAWAASEAVIGLLVEALLVATLARLFLGGLE
jgi:uncharacterized protein YjbI with pentapeptide repeats